MCSQIYSNIIQVFTLFMKAIFSQVRHPSHPGRGHASPTSHMTQFEQSDWLRSENFINIMIEYLTVPLWLRDSGNLDPGSLASQTCAESFVLSKGHIHILSAGLPILEPDSWSAVSMHLSELRVARISKLVLLVLKEAAR